MHYKKTFGDKVGEIVIYIILILLSIAFLYPIINTLSLSVSEADVLAGQSIKLLPKGFTLASYKYLLEDPKLYRYYFNTILYAGLGTFITLFVTSMIAYSLSDPLFSGKKVIGIYLVITMFVSGGLVPTYMLYYRLKLVDTIWAMVLPGIAAYNIMIYKTFFQGIPMSLKEAARIDGASHFKVLIRIIIPLSKPLLATMALFSIVGHWNSYFSALLYLNDTDLFPIQMYLRRLLIIAEMSDNAEMVAMGIELNVASRTVRASAVMVVIIPILCVYPFLQKYFAKGVLVGSVKG